MNSKEMTKEWVRCKKDPIYFIKNYIKIVVKSPTGNKVEKFNLWASQEICVNEFSKRRLGRVEQGEKEYKRFVILKGRQLGFSLLSGAYSLWLASFYDEVSILVISEKESLAKEFLSDIKYMYDNLPKWLQSEVAERNASILRFGHKDKDGVITGQNSWIKSIPTSQEAGRSKTLDLLIMDEAAFIRYADKVYTAASKTLSTSDGDIIMISTANGLGNLYANLWHDTNNDFKKMFFGWQANPNRNQAWYDEELRNAVDKKLHSQEHPSTPEEAFISTGNSAFDNTIIQEKINILREFKDYKTIDLSMNYNDVKQLKNDNGLVKIYHEPKKGANYVIGADVAEGLEKGDNSAAYVINRKNFRTEAAICGKIDPTTFARELEKLATYYNYAFLGVERNSIGYTVIDTLLGSYYNLYVSKVDDRGVTVERVGWQTTRKTKAIMVEELKIAISQDNLLCNDVDFWSECMTYRLKDGKYGGEGTSKDDRVMAMAIALMMTRYAPTETPKKQDVLIYEQREPERNITNAMGSEF